MSDEVTILDDALADMEDLPGAIQERILGIVERLERWPDVSGAKLLTGNWRGYYRIRTGDCRVVFRAMPDRIVIVRVANR